MKLPIREGGSLIFAVSAGQDGVRKMQSPHRVCPLKQPTGIARPSLHLSVFSLLFCSRHAVVMQNLPGTETVRIDAIL